MPRSPFNDTGGFAALWIMLIVFSGFAASAAQAHGEFGEHVEHFQDYIATYAGNVNALIDELDTIVSDYAANEPVADQIDAFVEHWETVKFHGAVETVVTPLYPPIWAAIGGFMQVVEQDKPMAAVRHWRDRIVIALSQGLGALKWAAHQVQSKDAGHPAGTETGHASGASTIARIQHNLRQVVAHYKAGEFKQARELIHQTYMRRFEGIEGALIARNAELVASLEVAFNAELPGLIKQRAPLAKIKAQVETMNSALDQAAKLLQQARKHQPEVF